MTASTKTVIVLAGPTAVGKTSVAIEVAKHFNTEIISADSRQCYKELKIGVARPAETQLQEVKHHFIATHSIQEHVTAATFEKYALEKATDIFLKKDVLLMVGGTGLYIDAFINGLDEIPVVPEEIRNAILNEYNLYGIDWLQQQVKKADPLFFEKGEIKNPHRLIRALEVNRLTGKSILSYRNKNKNPRPFKFIKIALHLEKEQLHKNIEFRVDEMIAHGLVEEVQSLLPQQHLKALQTVGYKEIFDYLNNKISIKEAVEEIKRSTKQYAKRQITWFKKDKEYTWLSPEANDIMNFVKEKISP